MTVNYTRLFPAIAVLSAFTVGVLRLVGLVKDAAVNLPFEDQWDLLRPLFEDRGPWVCFRWQHGPHRQGAGGVIDWFLYRATNWDVRAEAWAAVGILSLAAITAVVLAARLRGRLSWSDAGFALLLLSPLHWETMLLTPNLAHSILPLLLVLLLSYAWILPSGPWRITAIVSLYTLSLYTGFALCGAVVTLPLALGLRLKAQSESTALSNRELGIVLICMMAVLVSFGLGYRWDPAVPGWRFPVDHWWDYGRFGALMFTSLLGWRAITWGSTVVGAALLALVVGVFFMAVVALWRRGADALTRVVWLLTGTSLCYAALTAIGRLPISLEAAFMWRYTTLMMPALIGLGLFAQRWAATCPKLGQQLILAGWVSICALVWANFTPERNASVTAGAKRRWIAAYLKSHDLEMANRRSDFWVYYPAPASPMIKERLDFLEERRLTFFRDEPVKKSLDRDE